MIEKKPKISIITIVYNGSKQIEATILSIIKQTYNNVEYIIIDGGSTDGTIETIKKYESGISYWKSEKDKGIYDAMNKGLRKATGDYVWFINSGDAIYDYDTVEKIIGRIPPETDFIYGETVIVNDNGDILGLRRKQAPENLNWKHFKNGMVVSHQSAIVKRDIAPLFNEKYFLSADYEWVMISLKNSEHIVNSHQILSKYLEKGATTSNLIPSLLERFNIMREHYGLLFALAKNIILATGYFSFISRSKGNYRPIDKL